MSYTSNIKIEAILSASSVWDLLVKSYPLVAVSLPTELHLCCVGLLMLHYINNAFKSKIKTKEAYCLQCLGFTG